VLQAGAQRLGVGAGAGARGHENDLAAAVIGDERRVGGRAHGAPRAVQRAAQRVGATVAEQRGGVDEQRIAGSDGRLDGALAEQRIGAGVTLAGGVRGLAISADGARLYAVRRGALDIVDALAMQPAGSVRLPRRSPGGRVAVSPDGTRALVVLDRKQVALV